jgi:hypothetical protein
VGHCTRNDCALAGIAKRLAKMSGAQIGQSF